MTTDAKTSGADAQVVSDDAGVETAKTEAMAELSDGWMDTPSTEPEKTEEVPEKKEDVSEKKEESPKEKEEIPEKKEKGSEKKEEAEKKGFSKEIEKAAKPLPTKTSKYAGLQDGDYEIVKNDDGTEKIIVHAQHLVDDYERILEDPKTFFKIKNSKHNSAKAEVIAKMNGFRDDKLLSAGEKMGKVLDLFLKAKTEEERQEIVDEYFTDEMKYDDTESNVELDLQTKEIKSDKVGVKEDATLGEDEIKVVIKLWKAETDIRIDVDEAFNNEEVVSVYNSVLFDPTTGEKLSEEERIMLALDSVYDDKEEPEKPEGIQIGGHKKGETNYSSKKVEKKTEELREGWLD